MTTTYTGLDTAQISRTAVFTKRRRNEDNNKSDTALTSFEAVLVK